MWFGVGLLTLTLLLGVGAWADWYYGLPADAKAHYVGRQTCAECHTTQHDTWLGSHHDLAMDRATDETVLGDFNDAELTHHGTRSRMFRRDGKFFVNTEGPDGKLADFEVKFVFGVTPLQQYLVEFDRPADLPETAVARLQVLRVSWDTKNKRWFHLDPPDVKEKLAPDDDLHWTGIAQRWNHMCADCHTTNLRKGYDVASGTYRTTFSEIDVSCETCHGPGSLHVGLARSLSPFWDRERGYALAKLKGTSNVAEVHACAQCHSRRRVIAEGGHGGCNFYDYFANEVLTPAAYHADGQILDEVYEMGSFLQSKMYHKGIRCSDCHDPHSVRLKFQGNQVCTSCHQHPAGKYDGEIHHRHPMTSAGASCVECHMPETTYMDVDPRRDHSFRVPRPDLSVKFGTPNACSRCHIRDEQLPGAAGATPASRDSDELRVTSAELQELLAREDLQEYAHWLAAAERGDRLVKARLAEVNRWADATLDLWYGSARKKEPHFTEALHTARQMLPDAPAKLLGLLNDRNQSAIARATAALELAAYVEPKGEVVEALRKAVTDRDPQIRAAAVLSLHGEQSNATISALVPLLRDPTRLVRTEAARALAGVSQHLTGEERADFRAALAECLEIAAIDSDRAAGHLGLGILHESLGSVQEAERAYRTALRVEPRSVGPRTNLAALFESMVENTQQQAIQLAQSGRRQAAEQVMAMLPEAHQEIARLRAEEWALLERDARLAGAHAAVQSRVGMARHLAGWRKESESALLTAHLLEPRNPEHAYRLAIYYRDTGRPEEARPLARRLLELRPGNVMFQQFASELQQLPAH